MKSPPIDPLNPQHTQIIQHPEELTSLFDPDIQIVNWQRPQDDAITTYFEQALARGILGGGFRTVVQIGERLAAHFLPDLPGQSAIVDDVFLLTNVYADLLGCHTLGLRLEILDRAMCPRFHVDRTGIRMTCAYRGSGTEWIDDRWADRSKLGSESKGLSDEITGLYDERTAVQGAEPFDVVFCKGLLWQANNERGAIHRSPVVHPYGAPRIVVVIDAIWN